MSKIRLVWLLGLCVFAVDCSAGDQLLGSRDRGRGNDGIAGADGGDGQVTLGSCDESRPCTAPGMVCAMGQCRLGQGSCTSDADCQGDSFCCGAGCAVGTSSEGVCVAYSGQNEECRGEVVVGVFAPGVQCEWRGPPTGDAFPARKRVLTTPLVADLPNDSGASAEIVIVASATTRGGDRATDPPYDETDTGGVIRILNGQTCEQMEVIADSLGVRDTATPCVGDLDRDGNIDIVARHEDDTIRAYRWNATQGKFVAWWSSPLSRAGLSGLSKTEDWWGCSLYDLDDDGIAEVVSTDGAVFDGRTGTHRNPNQTGVILRSDPVLGDVDVDGKPELVANHVFQWDSTGLSWVIDHIGANATSEDRYTYAYADFGTPGTTAADFDRTQKDGVAEIVVTGGENGVVQIVTLNGQRILDLQGFVRGGPPTIGDFDNDGRPEIGRAGQYSFDVYDLDCAGGPSGCAGNYLLWTKPAQDGTSAMTGSAIFDFEADGEAEVVYADECYLRIYQGATGDVLYSAFRSSCTWWENPTIADVDNDSRTEIVVNSNFNCAVTCPTIDPIHPGARCLSGDDCRSGRCDQGFCRCTTDSDCDANPSRPGASKCSAAIAATPGTGNVCRASHPNPTDLVERDRLLSGVQVLRDQLDRWAPSRPIWNQHAYNITHVNDDGTIPSTSQWKQNFLQPDLNNFRQQVQVGPGGSAADLPDITGALDHESVCKVSGNTITLTAKVCNRGFRVVGADMPATFYLGPVEDNNVLCISYTNGPVPIGDECLPVSCEVDASVPPNSNITMVVNDDGKGNATTTECNTDNNTDSITIERCVVLR